MRASLLDMSRIDAKTVQYIAGLARLSLDEKEVQQMASDMDNILEYIETLEELDTSGITPTAHAIALTTPVREDEPSEGMDPELAVSNAPKRTGTAFSVPKVLDGDEN
jgi:aspartyl-tRNA(Asn)/glutamyl-tRNA(Gln) amidotransferase subunit C